MIKHAGPTVSIWMKTGEMPARGPLRQNASADVVIVGGGIAGLTTAYFLAGRNKSVIVLDDGPLGGGETERSSAHLATALDRRYHEIERLHGIEEARIAAESHSAAIRAIEVICEQENIACDFTRLDGWLYAPYGESSDEIDREFTACQRAGLTAIERHERVPGLGFETGACLRFPNQARFHPIKYLEGLLLAAERKGVRVFTGTHVNKIEGGKMRQAEDGGDDGKPGHVHTTSGHIVTAKAIVVATNTPVNDVLTIHTKQAAYRSYVVGMEIARGAALDALLWDTLDPFHYVRISPGEDMDILIVGGEDHKTGQDDDITSRHLRLEDWARARFPVTTTRYRWSGQVMNSTDGLGFIGRNPGDHDNVFIATGDSGNGLTNGTIAGLLLADLIACVENRWEKVYDPSRLPGGKDFVKETVNMVAQFADWVKPGDVARAEDIPRGEGAVVRRGLSLVAIYCAEDGSHIECSAVCPHLGAAVRWNSLEHTWDCPAHGSRFTPTGEPIGGPAITGLNR
ncbi:MAG: FAD-dependent oxidoreductase [Deltaproteobacteria bacterium]|nr:FAD-dependent oxidoreductase [Deltaproteobacteria bacterium]